MWFQQDGPTCHTVRDIISQRRSEFGKHFISRYVLAALEDNITRVISQIPAKLMEKVLQKWTFKMDQVNPSHG